MEGGGILSAAALFLLGTLQALHAQEETRFWSKSVSFPQEKIHVTTDRRQPMSRATRCGCRAHCVDAGDARTAHGEPLRLRGASHERTTCSCAASKILQRGGVYAGLSAPARDAHAQDEYVLCAYTLYMRNLGGDYLFSKPLSVNPYRQPEKRRRRTAAGPFDVAFFPEGGYLIDGQPCRVGFKALGKDGLSRQVTVDACATTVAAPSRVSPRATPAWGRSSSRRGPAGATRPNASRHRAARRGASTCPKPTTSPSSCASSPTTPPSSYPSVRLKSGRPAGIEAPRPPLRHAMLLQGVEPAARFAHLPARRTAGRPLPDPAAQPYGRSLLRAAGLQPPRDEEAEVTMRQEGTLQQRSEGAGRLVRGARHQTPTRTGRLHRRRHRPQGGGSRSDGGHVLPR